MKLVKNKQFSVFVILLTIVFLAFAAGYLVLRIRIQERATKEKPVVVLPEPSPPPEGVSTVYLGATNYHIHESYTVQEGWITNAKLEEAVTVESGTNLQGKVEFKAEFGGKEVKIKVPLSAYFIYSELGQEGITNLALSEEIIEKGFLINPGEYNLRFHFIPLSSGLTRERLLRWCETPTAQHHPECFWSKLKDFGNEKTDFITFVRKEFSDNGIFEVDSRLFILMGIMKIGD